MPWHLLVFNFLLFQGLWLVAVTLGDSVALLLFIPALALHFMYLRRVFAQQFLWRNELLLITLIMLLGFGVEYLAIVLNVWGDTTSTLPPVFLVLLWAGFGMTLHVSFGFLHNKLWLSAVLGGLFAPLSYSAGAALNPTLELADTLTSLSIVAAIWACVFPLLIYCAARLPLLKIATAAPTTKAVA